MDSPDDTVAAVALDARHLRRARRGVGTATPADTSFAADTVIALHQPGSGDSLQFSEGGRDGSCRHRRRHQGRHGRSAAARSEVESAMTFTREDDWVPRSLVATPTGRGASTRPAHLRERIAPPAAGDPGGVSIRLSGRKGRRAASRAQQAHGSPAFARAPGSHGPVPRGIINSRRRVLRPDGDFGRLGAALDLLKCRPFDGFARLGWRPYLFMTAGA